MVGMPYRRVGVTVSWHPRWGHATSYFQIGIKLLARWAILALCAVQWAGGMSRLCVGVGGGVPDMFSVLVLAFKCVACGFCCRPCLGRHFDNLTT